MNAKQWLACKVPGEMLAVLRDKVSDRKLQLFAVACCRAAWELFDGPSRTAIETAENYADDRVDEAARSAARSVIGIHKAAAWACVQRGRNMATAAELSLREIEVGLLPLLIAQTKNQRPRRQARTLLASQIHAPQCALLHDIFPDPFRPTVFSSSWRTPDVIDMARAVYEARSLPQGTLDPKILPILTDALEEAGCTAQAILDHLRQPGPHTRGCWVVDQVLARE